MITQLDRLTKCPKCQEEGACYSIPINESKLGYWCLGCGFNTTDLMIEDNFDFETYEETLPELYKELKYVDADKRVWYPTTINEKGGTVFINGTSKDNWQWSAIKTVLLTEEESNELKYKGQTHKSDPKSLKHFGNDFIEASDYIGLFNKD